MRRRQAKKNLKKKVNYKNEIRRQLGKKPIAFMGFDMEVRHISGELYFKGTQEVVAAGGVA